MDPESRQFDELDQIGMDMKNGRVPEIEPGGEAHRQGHGQGQPENPGQGHGKGRINPPHRHFGGH
jgi:hypothetical protein